MAFHAAMKRRGFLAWAAAALGARALPASAQKFQPPQDIMPMVLELTGGILPEKGGVEVELPLIVENGNAVPLRIRVESPMTAGNHVKAIHVFAERNPRPKVASFHLGPRSGKAEVFARVRLAGTQTVTVLAEHSDGRFRLGPRDVLVTSAACLDEASL